MVRRPDGKYRQTTLNLTGSFGKPVEKEWSRPHIESANSVKFGEAPNFLRDLFGLRSTQPLVQRYIFIALRDETRDLLFYFWDELHFRYCTLINGGVEFP